MIQKLKTTTVYVLRPSADDREMLDATLAGYRTAMTILDGTSGANLVALHEEAYERIRAETGLPSRIVTLALRDHARRAPGAPVDDFPLDSKVFAVKGPDTVSIATVAGRVVVPFSVAGYAAGWDDFAEARIAFEGDRVAIHVGIQSDGHPEKETTMSREGILSRLGRVIAGVANDAVDAVERGNPAAVAQQAVREIDKITLEARSALGVAVAAGHRLRSKLAETDEEIRDLDAKITLALDKGREDLARAAAGLQVDLEAQRTALRTAVDDNAAETAEAEAALRSIASARTDAMKRLDEAKRAERTKDQSERTRDPGQRNDARLADALAAVERATGVPARPATAAAEIEEINRLGRDDAIEAKLRAVRGTA